MLGAQLAEPRQLRDVREHDHGAAAVRRPPRGREDARQEAPLSPVGEGRAQRGAEVDALVGRGVGQGALQPVPLDAQLQELLGRLWDLAAERGEEPLGGGGVSTARR